MSQENNEIVNVPVIEIPDLENSSENGSKSSDHSENENDSTNTDLENSSNTEDNSSDELGSTNECSSSNTTARDKRRLKKSDSLPSNLPPEKLLPKVEKHAKKLALNKKNAEKAIKEFVKCTALARIVYGDGNYKFAESYINLAEAYLNLKEYAVQAEYHCENAKSIMLNNLTVSSSEKALVLLISLRMNYVLGCASMALKKFNDADEALQKAENIASQRAKIESVTDDEIDEWDIKLYSAIGKLNGKKGKYDKSINYFEKALEVMEDLHGEKSLKVIPLYQSLGSIEQMKGKKADHGKAIEYFLKAHEIASKKYDNGSPELSDTTWNLAVAYSKVGEDDAETSAESYFNECLAIYQTTYGPNHKKTLDTQDELVRLMLRTNRNDEAITMLRSTLSAKKEVFGEFSSAVADTWKFIGSVYLSQGDTDKAVTALSKCHELEVILHGANHRKSREIKNTIDTLLANPNLAAKYKNIKNETLKNRPNFCSTIKTPSSGPI